MASPLVEEVISSKEDANAAKQHLWAILRQKFPSELTFAIFPYNIPEINQIKVCLLFCHM